MLYLRARRLDTQHDRFVSQDTLDFFNRYIPFSGDPVGHIDPNGHKSQGLFHKSFWRNPNGILKGVSDFGFITASLLQVGGGVYYKSLWVVAAGMVTGQDAIMDTISDSMLHSQFSKAYRGVGRIINDSASTVIASSINYYSLSKGLEIGNSTLLFEPSVEGNEYSYTDIIHNEQNCADCVASHINRKLAGKALPVPSRKQPIEFSEKLNEMERQRDIIEFSVWAEI